MVGALFIQILCATSHQGGGEKMGQKKIGAFITLDGEKSFDQQSLHVIKVWPQ